jgi:hypothetical protein
VLALGAWLLVGCDTTRVDTVSSALAVRYLESCAPARVEAFTVEALGDFPVGGDSLVAFDARDGEGALRGLPTAAQLFRLRVSTSSFAGVAIAPAADDGARFDALVLPLGVHCPVLDAGLPALEGASAVALPGGDLLVAGGAVAGEGALARREALRVAVSRARVVAVADGMFLPRALAAAVGVAGEAWIVGGAQSLLEGSPALDSFERFDAASAAFLAPGRLTVERARAGAARLRDGSVLVAGGEASVGGATLDTLERIDADGTSRAVAARLPWPARDPQLLVRDDGLVWIVAARSSALVVALFDPLSEAVQALDSPLDGREPGPLVALPGGRLALLELAAGVTTGTLHLLLADGSLVTLDDWLTPFRGLREGRAVALRDGRILLTGVSDRGPEARVIDVGRREVRVRELDVAPTALFVRDDGSVAELAGSALRLVREDARTRFDNPGGTLLADDADVVALDAHSRWLRAGLELEARVAGARFELAALTYEDVRIEVDVRGRGELSLRRDDGAERALTLAPDQVGPALCRLARAGEGPVRVVRSGETVRVEAGGEARRCRLEGMQGPLMLGFRALDAGTRVKRLTVSRD